MIIMKGAPELEIREYRFSDGRSPYRSWLEILEPAVRARVQARIFRFERGNLGDHKPVGRGVWEARLNFGPGYRLYFGMERDRMILLLLGGDKSSQQKDIRRAQEYWADYQESENG